MAKVLLVASKSNSAVTQNSALTNYWLFPTSHSLANAGTSETGNSGAQVKFYNAGALSNLRVYVSAYSVNGDTTIRTRKNGANGSQSFTIPNGSGSGYYYDDTNTDSVSAGDLFAVQVVTGGSSGSIGMTSIACVFAATTGTATIWGANASNTLSRNTVYYRPVAGDLTANTTESNCQVRVKNAGTIKNFRVKINTNSINTDGSTCPRINGADVTGMTITLPASTTGIYEDTDSASVAAGDDVNYRLTTGTGSGSQNMQVGQMYLDFVTTNSGYAFLNQAAAGQTNNVTCYFAAGGSLGTNTTEALAQVYLKHAGSATALRVKATAGTGTSYVTLRKEGADTALSVNVTGSGSFEDTDAGVSIAATDRINYSRTGGSTTINAVALWMVNADPTATGRVSAADLDLTSTEIVGRTSAVDLDLVSSSIVSRASAADLDLTSTEAAGRVSAADLDLASTEAAARGSAVDLDLTSSEVASRVSAADIDVDWQERGARASAIDLDLSSTEMAGRASAADLDLTSTETAGRVSAVDLDLDGVEVAARASAADLDLETTEISAASALVSAADADVVSAEIQSRVSAVDADVASSEVAALISAVDADAAFLEYGARVSSADLDMAYSESAQSGRYSALRGTQVGIKRREPALVPSVEPNLVGSEASGRRSGTKLVPPTVGVGSSRADRRGRGGV